MTTGAVGTELRYRPAMPSAPPSHAGTDDRGGGLRRGVPALIPLVIGAVWALSLSGLHLQRMTDLGLITAMPALTLLMLALLTISFAVTVTRRRLDGRVALIHVLVLIIALYGITTFVESEPGFATVYRHVGIIDYLIGRRSVNPEIDAYFNWPGFFAFGALLVKLAGWHSALAFAAWGPLIFNLLYLAPLFAIFTWATEDRRVCWLAMWVFYAANWVGQDYVSPQAIGFLLWLSMLALLLRYFIPNPRALAPAASARAAVREFGPRAMHRLAARRPPSGGVRSIQVLVVMLLMYTAVVCGHQLTPVPAIIAVVGLVVLAGCTARGLPVLMVAALAIWIAFMTTTYLAGNLSQLTGGLFGVSSNLSAGISRVSGSAEHKVITELNIVFSLGMWLLGAAGFVRRLRAGRGDAAMVVVALAAFVLPVLQPYGGEILLRVFLFSLPGTALFAGFLVFPTEGARGGRRLVLRLSVVGCLMLLGFQYTRYGNERMDNITRGDFAAVNDLYRIAPRGSTLVGGTTNLPWTYKRFTQYQYDSLVTLKAWDARDPQPAQLLAQLQHQLRRTGGYVLFTASTQVEAEMFDNRPRLLPGLAALLRRTPGVTELYHHGEADIFHLPATQTG